MAIEAMPGRGAPATTAANRPTSGRHAGRRRRPLDGRMPLMAHLTELRSRLIKALIAVAVGMLVGFVAYDWIFDFLLDPYLQVADPGQEAVSSSRTRSRGSRSA